MIWDINAGVRIQEFSDRRRYQVSATADHSILANLVVTP